MRLRRADPAAPGYRRRRCGSGFSYVDADGRCLSDEEVRRCRESAAAGTASSPYRGEDDQWCDVRADDINHYLREASGLDMSAKDMRTWHGTLRAAVREVAEDLGNTPAVTRASYVDPRVVDAFLQGETLDLSTRSRDCGPGAEKALLRLLGD